MIDLAKIEQGQSLQTAQNTSSNQSCARIFTGAAVELFNLDKRESVTVGATQTANAAQSDSFFQDSNENGHREASNDREGDALSVHGISRSMELAHARRHMAARRLQMWARAARLTRLCARCTAFGGIGVTVRRTSKDGGGKHHLHHHLSASARSSYSSSPFSLEMLSKRTISNPAEFTSKIDNVTVFASALVKQFWVKATLTETVG